MQKEDKSSDKKGNSVDEKCETEEEDETNKHPIGYEFIPDKKFEEIYNGNTPDCSHNLLHKMHLYYEDKTVTHNFLIFPISNCRSGYS